MVLALQASSTDLLGGGVTSSTDRLYQQMQSRVASEVQAKTNKINDALENKYDTIGAKEDQLVKVKGSILNAQTAYENAISSLDDVDSELLSLRSVITDAPDNYSFAASAYNTALMSINFAVETYGTSLNPIGNVGPDWEPNTITYSTDTIVGKRSLNGTYAGTDFKITATDGSVWRPEDGTSVMQKINPDGSVDEDLFVSMSNGVTLTAYDQETGAITMSITYSAEEPPIEVSGTLERGGLGLMPSWFYRSQDSIDADLPAFSTEADWAAVRKDIESAVRKADVARAISEAGKAQTSSDMGKIDRQMDELTKEKSSALETSLNDRLNLQTQMQSQYQVMLLNLSRASSVQQQYANIFAGVTARKPFLSVTS
jgi:hypothetical protein